MTKGDPLLRRLRQGIPRRIMERWRAVRRGLAAHSPVRFTVKPDFLVIGGQKCGTSSLFWWLAAHPDVIAPRIKELHYFDRRFDKVTVGSYWGEFPTRWGMAALRIIRRRTVVTGEATPAYVFHPDVPQRVHAVLPDVKLIVILRDPAERAVSNYWMAVRSGAETLPLEEALAAEAERLQAGASILGPAYVMRGLYAEQLDRWTALYDRSQLLLLRFDDLVADPADVYRRTLRFLGVDPDAAPLPSFRPYNTGIKQPTDPATLARLREQFAEPNARLAADYGIDFTAAG